MGWSVKIGMVCFNNRRGVVNGSGFCTQEQSMFKSFYSLAA